MGFFKNIINKIREKKELSKKISALNTKNKEKIYDVKSVEQAKFDDGLRKSSGILKNAINEIAKSYQKIDEKFFEKLEETLILFDIGVVATNKILHSIEEEVRLQRIQDPNLIKEIIIDKIFLYYIQDSNLDVSLNIEDNRLNVILVSGVNGVGKTTTIAKLAAKFKKEKKKILLIAGDTFRAGAIEQLSIWAQRVGVDIVVPPKYGSDPASVIYKGLEKAKKENYDIVICDTSGRLQNKVHLMEEFKKIYKVIQKFEANAPHEMLLILDATTGQNGINQAKAFQDVSKITGIILTKMDSSSRGGIILMIKDIFNIPVKYIGLGEGLEDLSGFDIEKFILGITAEL
ncbi:MAG: signal recognition particle-docking protein FtsY [Mycoplasmoidaceae bacterium]